MAGSETVLVENWARGSLWRMTERRRVVAFIGAGGKTTCLQSLTQEIASAGCPVVATTTTKVWPEKGMFGWQNPAPPPSETKGPCFWYTEVMAESGKWIGPSRQAVDEAVLEELETGRRRFWIIEGDGAKGLKLKCWEAHEPQIPRQAECGVLVLDGGLWGNVLRAEQVHRSDACSDLLGRVWNAENAWSYFLRSPVFYPVYKEVFWVILWNAPGLKDVDRPLNDLYEEGVRISRENVNLRSRPRHLRLAAGDAKEGVLQWLDLW